MRIYQILPRLWGNGKMSGLDSDFFSYLNTLHVDYVWFTGIPCHASGLPFVKGNPGSPYAIDGYEDVNRYLADNEDDRIGEFESLVRRAHDAGIKVLTDLVPNHVGADSTEIPTCGYCDYDWTDTLKIDYSQHRSWDKMLEISRFWASKGVDGFRCDMTELVPKEFLTWLISSVKADYPDFIFIAEAYDRNNYRVFLDSIGFDLLYDKSGYYDIVREILCGGGSARALTWNWQSLGDMQTGMLNFLENHDEQRFASPFCAGKAEKAYAPMAVACLFNKASVMLYAGQEIGESALESDNGRTSIFNWATVDSLVKLKEWCKSGKGLSEEEAGVLGRYRKLMELSSSPLFSEGEIHDLCYLAPGCVGFNPDRHFAFIRFSSGEAAVVFCNFSEEPVDALIVIPDYVRERCKALEAISEVRMKTEAFDFAVKGF